jgi:hypothetical protein
MTGVVKVSSKERAAPVDQLVRVPPRTVVVGGGALVALFAVLGGAYAEAKDGGLVPSWFRVLPVGLNGEWTLPALFSGMLLVAAGLLAFRASEVVGDARRFRPLSVLGVLFVFMGLDEVLTIHEQLEEVVELAWWKFYAPVALAAGVCALVVLRRVWSDRQMRAALVAGGGCWLVAQFIETQQYDGTELVHRWTILPEEVLEMTGSLLFVLALLMIVQSAWPVRGPTPP